MGDLGPGLGLDLEVRSYLGVFRCVTQFIILFLIRFTCTNEAATQGKAASPFGATVTGFGTKQGTTGFSGKYQRMFNEQCVSQLKTFLLSNCLIIPCEHIQMFIKATGAGSTGMSFNFYCTNCNYIFHYCKNTELLY